MTEYTVVHDNAIEPLTVKVNEYITNGWEPIGGVTIVQIDYTEHGLGMDLRCAQAMIKR